MYKNKKYCQEISHKVPTRAASKNKFISPIPKIKLHQQHISFLGQKMFTELLYKIKNKKWQKLNKHIKVWAINNYTYIAKKLFKRSYIS